MAELVPLSNIADDRIEDLLDAAFGQDRHKKTAYLLRARSKPLPALSCAIHNATDLLATLQCWPVRIGDYRLVLVGPVAVRPDCQGQGIGNRLMHAMLEQASKIGNPPMVMIGDPDYYGRFGFTAEQTGGWTLPGPWEPHRLLARNEGDTRLPVTGMVEEDFDAL
ncbi:MAG: GNAT family N-acetyltransferase [Sphingorhabdus sp.]